MDVHREFAQLAVVEDGILRDEGKIGVTPEALRAWASELRPDDEVALEATGNSDAIATLLTPLVARVVVSNPSKTRAIAEAKVKTDKVDARILAQLLAADFLPPVWLPDDRTRSLRRQVMRRAHVVRQRTRLKNQVHAILARNLAPTPPVSDLFGKTGRHWLSRQPLPADERASVQALLRQLDFHAHELCTVGSAKPAAPMCVVCWWRRPGRPVAHQGPCVRSISASNPDADFRPRSWPPPAR
ncbi:IS110 family transposase [Mycobacterium saskatchewanense]|uniref:IS110 family transposase n=1 Tax=Mycobacterium saskatchewanense TaxID=220927 RepID=UPI0038CBFC32